MKTFTPSIVEGSIFTCNRSAMAGIVGTIPASILSAALRHSSPVFHRSCHAGLSGAAMNFCMPELTSVGTGSDFAGTSRGASCSASHGAGRVMSRTKALHSFTCSATRKLLAERGVELLSAGSMKYRGFTKTFTLSCPPRPIWSKCSDALIQNSSRCVQRATALKIDISLVGELSS